MRLQRAARDGRPSRTAGRIGNAGGAASTLGAVLATGVNGQMSAVLILPEDQIGQTMLAGDTWTMRATKQITDASLDASWNNACTQLSALNAWDDADTLNDTNQIMLVTGAPSTTYPRTTFLKTVNPRGSGAHTFEMTGVIQSVPTTPPSTTWPATLGDNTLTVLTTHISLGSTFRLRNAVGWCRVSTNPDEIPPKFFNGTETTWVL